MPETAAPEGISHQKAANRFTTEDAPSVLAAADEPWWPSRYQYKVWITDIITELGVTPDGWWYGFCTCHDEVRDPQKPSVMVNFKAGVIRCLGDPCCHSRRTMSLGNFLLKSREGVTHAAEAR